MAGTDSWQVPASLISRHCHTGLVLYLHYVQSCMGIEHAEDQFAEKGGATIENAMHLRGILEGEQQCPICGKEQDECNCTCHLEYMIDGVMISCGQRCAVGRIWPPCVTCKPCGTCCRCSHNRQHQPPPPPPQEAERAESPSQMHTSRMYATEMIEYDASLMFPNLNSFQFN